MKEIVGATYNNFYEFSTEKEEVSQLVGKFETRPWEVEVTGLVANPGKFALDDLVRKMTLEERLYRFRCVEAWSMVIPWTGFPLSRLMKLVQPKSEAGYVRFWTAALPKQMPGIKRYASWGYKFPYYEGLTLAEASNDLSFMVTGVYGHELTKQHGAPIRLIVPWKYGFKSIKSVVKIEFVKDKPPTFWNDLYPKEYGFSANINPKVPHLRWSQATERVLGTTRSRPLCAGQETAPQEEVRPDIE
jgi:sulfoxide reductase catalytic subunit YedY